MGMKDAMDEFEKAELSRVKAELKEVRKLLEGTEVLAGNLLAVITATDKRCLRKHEIDLIKGMAMSILSGDEIEGSFKVEQDKIIHCASVAMITAEKFTKDGGKS